ncbi:MAG: hypothetical protein PHT88_03805 [Candidatus Moranbacteria bacterium]|nr:hypothetical protein [Candidatus Moranbacteria bacterium]
MFKKDDNILSKDDPDNENLFVADVYGNSDGRLYANVYRFSNDDVWNAGSSHRFVVPQLTA